MNRRRRVAVLVDLSLWVALCLPVLDAGPHDGGIRSGPAHVR
ncbi:MULTISPECIES: hypothetical protein [unclassified Streptomyces]|nr:MULTISPECIES: hypothetical protein [unclassified Streptomyces]